MSFFGKGQNADPKSANYLRGPGPWTTIVDRKELSLGYERGAGTLWAGFHLQVFPVPCNSYLTIKLMKHDDRKN